MKLKALLLLQMLLMPLVRVLVALAPKIFFPVIQFSAPQGPYFVGVRDTQFVDESRTDNLRTGEKRKLMARIWYPASQVDGLERRRLFSTAEYPSMEKGLKVSLGYTKSMIQQLAQTQTWSYENAPLIQCDEGALPVIIFSHGFGCLVGNNTHLCEHLASYGYLVISVAHPYSSGVVHFPDGSMTLLANKLKQVFRKPELINAASAVLKAESVRERKAATTSWSSNICIAALNKVWVADSRACLDHISAGTCQPSINDITSAGNFSRVGALGMSFGGSASATLAEEDERIAAVINLDGGQADTRLINQQIRVPLLMLHSNALPMASGGGFNDFHYEPHQEAGCSGKVYRAVINNAAHMDFTDWTLLEGSLIRGLMGLGNIDGQRMLNVTADACQSFYDSYVKATDSDTSVLTSLAEKWPEIEPLDMSSVRNSAKAMA